MRTVIKTLNIGHAALSAVSSGRRERLAEFSGKIEIIERQDMVPILGRRCKGEKKIYASFILCDDINYETEHHFHSGRPYEAVGDIQGESKCERLIFSGLRFEDNDPVTGCLTFEITDLELIKMLLNL